MAHEFSVTIETEKVAEVTAVGIQGVPGVADSIENIANVDAIGAEDGSVLVLDVQRNKWVATRVLEKQDITGGQY
jgi:hypothetical protein